MGLYDRRFNAMAKMLTIKQAWQYFAAEVIFQALLDILMQASRGYVTATHQEDAALWFARGDHEEWCIMAGIDHDVIARYARELALNKIGSEEHPVTIKQIVLPASIPSWRRHDVRM